MIIEKELLKMGFLKKDQSSRWGIKESWIDGIKPYGLIYNSSLAIDKNNYNEMILSFDDVLGASSEYLNLKKIINKFETTASKIIKSCQHAFIVFSYLDPEDQLKIDGHKHVHPPLEDNSDCLTLSFAIPLNQIAANENNYFLYHNNENKRYSPRAYLSYNWIEKQNFKFEKILIEPKKIFQLEFNSTKYIHYYNNTKNLIMWIVFDGVEYFDAQRKQNVQEKINHQYLNENY